ncbi:Lrp/AsnC family transcriptional regulator [Cumulibacter manganitolerans]|uniref:Lrp/AsnC family transcriptional regulator n=1 Tax=Cumulibacter manganitolerans TaxID=1884992 RepID=UPI0012965FE0|nr:Lrp/AsnC family transcriptional regulator [Cumulibacter manganitolerans]
MDDVDRKIIQVLREAGRTSYVALGKEVGLSSPAVHERVNKLEAQGVITGYHASVDPTAIGLGVTALVGIYTGGSGDESVLLEELRKMPEIEDCMYVAGDESYFVKIRVTDMLALERLLLAIGELKGVTRTRTTIAISTKWEGRAGGKSGLDADVDDSE